VLAVPLVAMTVNVTREFGRGGDANGVVKARDG
jgi:hypothetical protein